MPSVADTCASEKPVWGLHETDVSMKDMPHPSPDAEKHLLLLSASCFSLQVFPNTQGAAAVSGCGAGTRKQPVL